MKNQYRGGDCLKRGGFGQFANLRGAWIRFSFQIHCIMLLFVGTLLI